MEQAFWTPEFQSLYKQAWKKLDTLIKEHEGIEFLKVVRVFDPLQLPVLSKNIEDYKNLLPELSENETLLREFEIYLKANVEIDLDQDLIQFWKKLHK